MITDDIMKSKSLGFEILNVNVNLLRIQIGKSTGGVSDGDQLPCIELEKRCLDPVTT